MTALEKYLAELNKQKQLAEGRFQNLNSFQHQLLNSSYNWLVNNLNLQNGVFEIPGNLPGLMNSFVDNILTLADKSTAYTGAVQNYISDLTAIKKNIVDYHAGYNKLIVDTPGLKAVQKAVVGEVIDQYSENGLNSHFAQPLRELIYGNILGGMSQSDAKRYLQEYIIGERDESGKLHRYLEQTAQQGVDSYAGAINMKLKKDFNFTGYVISGSIIDNSSKQCIHAIETSESGYLSFANWEKVLQIARENKKAKLIDGTNIDNLPLNKLHWGCRHEFTPFFKKEDHVEPVKTEKKAPKPTPKPKVEEAKPISKPKTTKEAEAEIVATKHVKAADFSKLSVHTSEVFNSGVKEIYEAYNLDPIELKSTTGKGTFRARAHGGFVEVHGVNIENKETTTGAGAYNAKKEVKIANAKGNIDYLKQQLAKFGTDSSIKKHYEKELKKFEKALEDYEGYTRWTVDNSKRGTVLHEFGHVINDQRSGGINGYIFTKKEFRDSGSIGAEEMKHNKQWKELFRKIEKSPERFKLSEYGMYDAAEMFAESFVLYFTGRKNELPAGIEAFLDKYLKNLKR